MSCYIDPADRILRRFGVLPPGISQSQCDRPAEALADADLEHIWIACPKSMRERIAMQFAQARADDVRDALLDAPGSDYQRATATPAALGAVLWRAWISYRDQMLNQFYRRGQINLE
jgi:hypothetical protein